MADFDFRRLDFPDHPQVPGRMYMFDDRPAFEAARRRRLHIFLWTAIGVAAAACGFVAMLLLRSASCS